DFLCIGCLHFCIPPFDNYIQLPYIKSVVLPQKETFCPIKGLKKKTVWYSLHANTPGYPAHERKVLALLNPDSDEHRHPTRKPRQQFRIEVVTVRAHRKKVELPGQSSAGFFQT
ncbi:MAG: hypothetical protein NTV84_09875, partial [Methanoregula sp.]|nr:hypothetical protein [Methanoregula sp.]